MGPAAPAGQKALKLADFLCSAVYSANPAPRVEARAVAIRGRAEAAEGQCGRRRVMRCDELGQRRFGRSCLMRRARPPCDLISGRKYFTYTVTTGRIASGKKSKYRKGLAGLAMQSRKRPA
jgi:hypothetical protein